MDNVGIRPIRNQILVRQDSEKETTSSGLVYLPQGVRERFEDYATVLAVGPKVAENGEVKVGDRVLFKRRPDSALLGDGLEGGKEEWKNVLVLQEEDILLVVDIEAV